MPAFPAIAAFVAGIVGYPIPVVCQPFTQGETITYQVSGQLGSATLSAGPFSGLEAGIMHPQTVPIGDTVTITVGGQVVTLPIAPATTPMTQAYGAPGGWVVVPSFIAVGICDRWTSTDPAARGQALLTAIHESMHAKYADGNEALTECRALQALPTQLASLWPGVADPGSEPLHPSQPSRPARWRKAHPGLWAKLLGTYRRGYAQWRTADAQWQNASDDWTRYQEILGAAETMDASEPPQYHGATC